MEHGERARGRALSIIQENNHNLNADVIYCIKTSLRPLTTRSLLSNGRGAGVVIQAVYTV